MSMGRMYCERCGDEHGALADCQEISESTETPCYAIDICDAEKQAIEALNELDGSAAGEVRALVKVRNMIFAAYHLGRADFDA